MDTLTAVKTFGPYIANTIIERVVKKAMAEYLDKEALEDKPIAKPPKKPKKKPNPPPKTTNVVSSDSDSDGDGFGPPATAPVNSPDNDKPTASDKEFIDDTNDNGLDSDTQAEFDAMKRKELAGKLKAKLKAKEKKRERKNAISEEEEEKPPQPPKKKKKTQPALNHMSLISNDEGDGDSYDEAEDSRPNEYAGNEEEKLTREEAAKAQKCPFCLGDLMIGSSPDKNTGEMKTWCFCAKKNCKWTFVPSHLVNEFIVTAHVTVAEEFQYPNPKPMCSHGLPLQATWIHNTEKMDTDDAAILKNCIFLICEIGSKDPEDRVPCESVLLSNPPDGMDPKPIVERYKKMVLKKKIASRKAAQRFNYDSQNALARIMADPKFKRDFGSKVNKQRRR